MVTTFDALSYSKQLKAVGVSPQEAEVHAESLSDALRAHLDHWATKADLNALSAATKADLKELEYKLTIKLGAVVTYIEHLSFLFSILYAILDFSCRYQPIKL